MPGPSKIDLYKEHKAEYAAPKRPAIVDISPARYLSIEGHGEAGSREFQSQLGALFSVAFALKTAAKKEGRDYAVSKLEGQWWGENPDEILMGQQRTVWNWRLLIRVPDFLVAEKLEETARKLAESGKSHEATQVSLQTIAEGKCVQMLHVGPYTAEAPTLHAMREFAEAHGLALRGLHHEIYISDPRRTTPQKLRTILRHPVEPSSTQPS